MLLMVLVMNDLATTSKFTPSRLDIDSWKATVNKELLAFFLEWDWLSLKMIKPEERSDIVDEGLPLMESFKSGIFKGENTT